MMDCEMTGDGLWNDWWWTVKWELCYCVNGRALSLKPSDTVCMKRGSEHCWKEFWIRGKDGEVSSYCSCKWYCRYVQWIEHLWRLALWQLLINVILITASDDMTVQLGPHSLWTKWLEVSVNSSLSAVLLQRAKSLRSETLVTVCLLSKDISADFIPNYVQNNLLQL
jgi:hypothetical protein